MVNLNDVTVTFYSYRTAMVRDIVAKLPSAACKDWELELARLAHANRDNHTVYQIESRDTETVYVWFTDMHVYIGNQIEVGRW